MFPQMNAAHTLLDPSAIVGALGLITQLVAGVTFAAGALGKWVQRTEFVSAVGDYALVPARLVPIAAGALLVLEGGIGVLLLARIEAPWAARLAAALLAGFAFAIAINLARGRTHIDCGCSFSGQRHPISALLAMRNVCIAVLLVLASTTHLPTPTGIAFIVGFPVALCFWLLYQAYAAVQATRPAERLS
jgi:hypothetical protein